MCKTVALAHIEAHYAEKLGVDGIPLLKEHAKHEALGSPVPKFSVRKLAKECGSKQGEILERGGISRLAARMGYQTTTTKPATLNEFECFIRESITQEAPVFACFPVTANSLDPNFGRPADYNGKNEHAAVIVAHDAVHHTVDLVHWGETWRAVPAAVLHEKMQQLPESREQEIYTRVGDSVSDQTKNHSVVSYKYDLITNRAGADGQSLLHSIIPGPGTGFQNTLISVSPDPGHPRWQTSAGDSADTALLNPPHSGP